MSDQTHSGRPGEITEALRAWRQGHAEDEERLLRLVYEELHSMARSVLRGERSGHTLQPTALVHELYLRLLAQRHVDWQSRNHFFAIAARVMRRILVDHARARTREKRGGGLEKVPLDDLPDLGVTQQGELAALDDALTALGEIDPRKATIVELRYFGGFTAEETAEILQVSEPTVRRHWRLAKAWLYREISGEAPAGS